MNTKLFLLLTSYSAWWWWWKKVRFNLFSRLFLSWLHLDLAIFYSWMFNFLQQHKSIIARRQGKEGNKRIVQVENRLFFRRNVHRQGIKIFNQKSNLRIFLSLFLISQSSKFNLNEECCELWVKTKFFSQSTTTRRGEGER